MAVAKKLADLKDGDTWTGKIGAQEYGVVDGVITCCTVVIVKEVYTAKELADKKKQLTNDVAHRQTLLAEVNVRLGKLTE